MAITDVYGPQDWSAGVISVTTPVTSHANYPEITYIEKALTVNGVGPAGERMLESADYGASALTAANWGPDAGGYFDIGVAALPTGFFIECDLRFDPAVEAAVGDFALPFVLGARRTAPSEGFHEAFGIRLALTEGKIYAIENTSEIEPGFGSVSADNALHALKAFLQLSSDNGGAASDGIVKVWLDGVLILNKTTSQLFVDAWAGAPATAINYFSLGRYGLVPVTNFHVYYGTAAAAATVPGDDSTPCCGSSVDPNDPGPGGTGGALPIDPYEALQPWIPACAGGGQVDTAADLTDSESWA